MVMTEGTPQDGRVHTRALEEGELEYLRDLMTRWQSYSFVSAGVGLVLGLIAGSMRGYVVGGAAQISSTAAYSLAAALIVSGALGCWIMQVVAKRIARDLEASVAVQVKTPLTSRLSGSYVLLDTSGPRFRLTRTGWERAGPQGTGADRTLAIAPFSRVVLAVDGRAAYP